MVNALIVGPPVALYVLLMFRISAFRKDGRRLGAHFGVPPLTWMALFDRERYDPRGQRLLPWLYVATAASLVGLAIVLIRVGSSR